MSGHSLKELISRRSSQSATPEESFSCGDKVGEIGPRTSCWEVITTDPAYYNKSIAPELREALEDCPGALVTEDIVDFHFYMIGESESKAVPTVLFTSENAKLRKETRKIVIKKTKKSEVLSKSSRIKMADYDRDPGCQRLEQLATPISSATAKKDDGSEPRVLYNPSETLRARGISIYVRHESGIRKATANAIRIGEEIYLQSVHHVLKSSTNHQGESDPEDEECEIDYGSDSDTESEPEGEQIRTTTQLAPPQEEDTEVDEETSLSQNQYTQELPTALESPSTIATTSAQPIHNPGMTSRPHEIQAKFQARETSIPPIESLEYVGSVIVSSSTLDYSLITVKNPAMRKSLEAWLSDKSRLMIEWDKVSQIVKPNTRVVAYLTTGALMGTSAQNSSHIRLPGSEVFQEAYIVRLNGALSYGDCGSLVADATTGELYGYLVAGCRSTGTAYIVPVHYMFSDIESARTRFKDQVSSSSSFCGMLPRSTPKSQTHLRNGPPPHAEYQTKKRFQKRSPINPRKKRWRSRSLEHRHLSDEFFFRCKTTEPRMGSVQEEVLEDFCHSSSLLLAETQYASQIPRIWLDSRCGSKSHSHISTQWHTATTLCNALTKSNNEHPQVYRRLIYVPELNADSVSALKETALPHQIVALDDAMYNHIAGRASMRVVIPTVGFPIFRLEFSLPCFALRKIPPTQECKGNYPEALDISFLKLEGASEKIHHHYLGKFRFTLVCVGWDESKWAAYAFSTNGDDYRDQVFDEGHSDDEWIDQPTEDPIAANFGHCLDANKPIWNPRLYWLENVERATEKATDEWSKIGYRLRKIYDTWRRKQPGRLQSTRLMNEGLVWATQTVALLAELSEQLSTIVCVVRRFMSPGGDCDYFADMTSDGAVLALQLIGKHLETLEDLLESLRALEYMSRQTAKTFELQMEMENSRVSLRSSQLSHEANTTALKTQKIAIRQTYMSYSNSINAGLMLSTNQILTPVVIVTAYYSTQEPIFGFPRNGKTFITGVVVLYFVLRTLNVGIVLARRYVRSNRVLALVALGQLEKLFDLESEHEVKECV